jgi:Fe-S cluster assembly protein SufD
MQTLAQMESVNVLADRGPTWVADVRHQAWSDSERLPFPDRRDERWRYTDTTPLQAGTYRVQATGITGDSPGLPAGARRLLERLSPRRPAGQIVLADGQVAHSSLSVEAKRAGVTLAGLEEAAGWWPDLLRNRLGALVGIEDHFTARSLALFSGGTFLHVPGGTRLELPLRSLTWATSGGVYLSPRNVVVVDPGAEVVFVDLYASDATAQPTLAAPVTELFVGAGARVGWVTWQQWGAGVNHHAHLRAHLDRDAELRSLVVSLGGELSRTEAEVQLAGEGARAQLLGLYFPQGRQQVEHWTVQDHRAPRTRSDLAYRGALAGESRAVYYGTIRVHPEARATDAYQDNRNLLLSGRARADTNPQLEIETDEVRCTHGAAVGPIDPEQVFYLESRGIPRPLARRLVVQGFYQQLLQQADWSGLGADLTRAIEQRTESAEGPGAGEADA